MSVIWIFAEPRSGSTAFSNKVALHLNRKYFFINSLKDLDRALTVNNPKQYLFYTHGFSYLERLNEYSYDKFIIRCTRKNKVEQCLSHLVTGWVNRNSSQKDYFWNLDIENSAEKIELLNSTTPTIFTKQQILNYLNRSSLKEEYWNKFSSIYPNTTVFYEDLCSDGVSIPEIDLYSYSITTDDSVTIKMPNYKERLCLNHDMVKRWIEEYQNR